MMGQVSSPPGGSNDPEKIASKNSWKKLHPAIPEIEFFNVKSNMIKHLDVCQFTMAPSKSATSFYS